MRIVFMGTPDFAAASLRRLAEDGHEVCGVFTQPDRPKNRGHRLAFSPVKELALELGLPVYQPDTFRDGSVLETLCSLSPELIVVAAYGRILPEAVLNLPKYGSINVHSSLLPAYRGAAPINWAVLNGETETGVSIMYMVKALDAGDVILQKRTAIGEQEDAGALTVRLAALGAEALSEAVQSIADGTASRTTQDPAQVTYAPMLSRELSEVDWNRPARAVQCQIRGLIPWPCASTAALNGETVKLYRAEVVEPPDTLPEGTKPGTVSSAGKQGIDVVCGDGKLLRILELQSQGGKRMAASAWLLGHPLKTLS